MTSTPSWFYRQSAVIPYRVVDGQVEVALVTSRKRRRWIIPKGVVDPGETPEGSAVREAEEEAGIIGTVGPNPIGHYTYEKWDGTCHVIVFPMLVERVLEVWPESEFRERKWLPAKEAAELVGEPAVREMILGLEQL